MTVAPDVIAIIARQAVLAPDQVTPEMRLDALGIDSLGRVEIIFALEEHFDIAIPFNANRPDADAFDLSSVGAVVAAVERLIAAGR